MAAQQPNYRAYTVVKRGEGQDDFWLAIGAAFAHQSGDGFNVVLQALPIPNGDGQCKIVLRPPKADDTDQQPQERTVQNIKSGSRRRNPPHRRGEADSRAAGRFPDGFFLVSFHQLRRSRGAHLYDSSSRSCAP